MSRDVIIPPRLTSQLSNTITMHLRVFLFFVSAASASAVNDTIIWGPYRPNLYFGLRPRLPQSLMTGLMWFGTHDYASLQRWYLSFPFVDTTFDVLQ